MKLRLIIFATILVTLLSSTSSLTEARELVNKPPAEYLTMTSNAVATSCEVRGVWLNAYAFSQDSLRSDTLQKIKKANLNTIFALAPPVGSNRGWSTSSNFSKLLNEAKNMGFSVHAWVINRQRPKSGLADFTSSAEQTAQANWGIQLLNTYPKLDGIHFDYIRYDKYEVATTTGLYAHLPKVDETKTLAVNNTVKKAFQEIKRFFPNKKLTAAVKLIAGNGRLSGGPYPKEGPPYFWSKDLPFQRENQQDVLTWVKSGYIDGVQPMNYTLNDTYWSFDAQQWKQNLGTKINSVYMGLGWLTEPGNSDFGYDAPGIVRKIKSGRSLGLKGFTIFQLGAFQTPAQKDWELVNALSIDSKANNFDAPFEQAVPSCLNTVTSTSPDLPTATATPTLTGTVTPGPTVTITETPTPTPTLPNSPSPVPTSTPVSTPFPEPQPDLISLAFTGPTQVAPGQTFEVKLEAQNVANDGLYGAQLEINYDPAMISVANLQTNSNLSFVVRNAADNTLGKISLAASQQGNVPGLTGNVTLLTFTATAANNSGVNNFTLQNVKLGNVQAIPFTTTLGNYAVTIGADPTSEPTAIPTDEPTPVPTDEPTPIPTDPPTPVPTDEPTPIPTDEPTPVPTDEPTPVPTDEPTPIPTDEPTPIPTDEPTPVPTDEPTPVPTDQPTPQPTDEPFVTTVLGQVILAGRANNNWAGATVTIADSGQSATTDAGGNFSIANVTSGAHTSISADAPGYLPAVCSAPSFIGAQVTLANIGLLSGDLNDDAKIDAVDATTLGVSFGNTGPNLPADINQDSVVDIFDIILLSINFGQGQQVWNCASVQPLSQIAE